MLKKVLKSILPPICVDLFRLAFPLKVSDSQTAAANLIDKEVIDFWGNTSLFALEVIQRHGPLNEMSLLSLGNRMAHLADYVAVFGKVYHSTLLKTMFPVSLNSVRKRVLRGFFQLLLILNVHCGTENVDFNAEPVVSTSGTKAGCRCPYQVKLPRNDWRRVYTCGRKYRRASNRKLDRRQCTTEP